MYLGKFALVTITILIVMMMGMFTCNANVANTSIDQTEINKNIQYFVTMGKITSSGDEKFQCALQLMKLKDDKDAITFLKEASDAGVKEASLLLGKIFYKGIANSQISIPRDELQGLKYFLKAEEYWIINNKISDIQKEASTGNANYQCFLGELYFYGHAGINMSYENRVKKAEKLFLQSANTGNSSAAFDLVYLYNRVKLYNDSYVWIQKAANMGDSMAMFVMYSLYDPRVDVNSTSIGGLLLFHYKMVIKDDSLAMEWLQKGLGKGEVWAKREIAIRYIDGTGIDKNIDLGCKLLSEAAATGDTQSMQAIKTLRMVNAIKNLSDAGNTDAKITYKMLMR